MLTEPLLASLGPLTGPLIGEPRQRRPTAPVNLTPEQENSLLRELANQTGQAVESLFLALDTPGAIARGVIAGDPLSGFSWDADRRVTGSELNEKLGLNPENGWLKALSGFGTEVVADPLFWLSGGLSSLSKAGAAAKNAGLLKNAPLAYMQKYGTDAAEQTMRGGYITDLFQKNFIPQTAGNYKAVAPVGQRLSQASVTLDDVIAASPNPTSAMDELVKSLGSKEAVDAIRGDTLGGLLGVNVGGINMAFKPPGSDSILDALDYLGAKTRFSYPGRLATAATSRAVEGAVDAGEQITALRSSLLEKTAREQAQTQATEHGLLLSKIVLSDRSKRLLGSDTLFSPQGNDLLTRLAENKPTTNDLNIIADTPALTDWRNSWDKIRTNIFTQRENLALAGPSRYSDRYGVEYSPRFGDEFDFGDQGRGVGRGLYTAAEPETYGRRKHLITPGGTDDLRKISMLPEIINYAQPNSGVTDEQAGNAILKWFKMNHPAEPMQLPQAMLIARTMARRKLDLPPGVPVFAAHPANTQARRIISHSVAQSRANFILESLAEASELGGRTTKVGRYRNLADSWDEIARGSGFDLTKNKASKEAVDVLRAKMSLSSGTPIQNIDLSQYSVPEAVVRRLQRISDFYSVPQAQGEVSKFLDGWTTLFKSFVLATPRRFVRDAYSNAISGFLETGNAPLQLSSMYAASKIVNGKYDDVMSTLRTIPRYAGMTDQQALDQFLTEAGGTGVLAGLQSSELLSSVRTGSMNQLIPGSTPISISRGLSEFIPDGSRNVFQQAADIASPFTNFVKGTLKDQYEQRNPLLRASNTINDTVDSIGRLGTFLALLRQGVSPSEAADRVRRALVDYQSLTLTERTWLRSIFPWYAYNSRIGKYVADNLYNRPGGSVSQMFRASVNAQRADDDEDYIPANLRKSFALRIPDSLTQMVGLYQPGLKWFLQDFDLPGVDVVNLLDPNSLSGTLKNVFAQSSPPIQSIVSLATGRDLFTDKPLKETVTHQDRLYQALTGDPNLLSPAAKVFLGLVPGAQVPTQFFGKLADDRIEDPMMRLLAAGINFGSGFKVRPVNELDMIRDIQQKIGDDAGLSMKTRTMSRQWIPDELEPTLTPRERALNELSKKKAREATRIRAQQELQKQAQR
jgi:hypothetical protein